MNMEKFQDRLVLLSSFLVTALGLSVIAGWYLKIPILLQIHPSFAPMQYNTALGFLLSGLALFFLKYSYTRVAQLFAFGVVLIGGLTLLQIVTGLNLHIDQLFMQHYITVRTSMTGRMAPNTALCLLLSGINLLVLLSPLSQKIKAYLSGVLVPAIMALAVVALTGYIVGAETAYGWANLTRMAVHTAVGFIVLGLALNGVRQAGTHSGNLTAVGITLVVIVLSAWQVMETRELDLLKRAVNLRVEQEKINMLANIRQNYNGLQRMALRWKLHNGTRKVEWQQDANRVVNDSDYRLIVRYPANGIGAPWVAGESKEFTDSAMPLLTAELCQLLESTPRIILNPPIVGALLVEMVPLNNSQHADGCMIAITSLSRIVEHVRAAIGSQNYPLSIFDNGQWIYQEASDGRWYAEAIVEDNGLKLRLQLTPTESQLATGWIPVSVLIFGLALSSLILFLLSGIKARKRQELQFSQVVEMAPYALIMVDRQGLIQMVNAKTESTFDYASADLLGKPVELLIPSEFHNQHIGHRNNYMSKPSSRSMGIGSDFFGQRRDGSNFPVEVVLNPITTPDGTKFIAAIMDITERKQAEVLQQKYIVELTRINDELNNFAYIASHDLKSPLRGIDQLATWIEDDMGDALNPEVQNHLRLMRNRIKRMEMLLTDLLAYSRAGRTDDEIVSVETAEMVSNIFELTANTKNIRLEIGHDMPILSTRKVPLELVFRNLIGNAIKHHDKTNGYIMINARIVGENIEFSIKDDGPGIAAEHQQRVFGMFQTLKPRDEMEGSGMGLAMVKKTVELVGGIVTLESDGLHGSTFRFTWPINLHKEVLI